MSITGLLLSSLLLIVGAAAALVYGWINASEALVISSIALSAAAAVFLAMGLYRSRPRRGPARAPQKKKRARAGRSGR
jgi:membrane protein implicated in regulation of membrane protease activity